MRDVKSLRMCLSASFRVFVTIHSDGHSRKIRVCIMATSRGIYIHHGEVQRQIQIHAYRFFFSSMVYVLIVRNRQDESVSDYNQ